MAVRELAEHPLGLTWVDDDALQRASHALVDDGRVWLVDPFDAPEALERVAALGEVAGVLQLFMAHGRDGRRIAERFGAPFYPLPDAIPDAPFELVRIDALRVWKERALWWPQRRGLVVAESVGTGPHFAVGPGPAGIHPVRRALPPTQLERLTPEHLLVGHGAPLHGASTTAALSEALRRSRRDIPTLIVKLPSIFRSMQGRS